MVYRSIIDLMNMLKRIMVSIFGRIFCLIKSILLLIFYIKLKFYNNLKLNIPFNILKTQVRRLFFPVSPHTTMDALMKNKIILDNFVSINEKVFFQFSQDTIIGMPDCNNAKEVIVNDIREILVDNIYEYKFCKLLKGDVVFDCGANVGIFSIYAQTKIGPKGTVVAIEPVPFIKEVLKNNLTKTQIKTGVIFIDKPLSNDIRCRKMKIVPDCFTMCRLYENGENTKVDNFEVNSVTIDHIVKTLGLSRVDFIKMDIEGEELNALLGAKNTLMKYKPKLAISAYHDYDDFIKIPETIIKINPNYKVFVVNKISPMCYAY